MNGSLLENVSPIPAVLYQPETEISAPSLLHVSLVVLQLQADVQRSPAFLHLQRTFMHLVVQLHVTTWSKDSGTAGRDMSVGIRDAFSNRHPMVSGRGRSGCCLSACRQTDI